MSETKSANLVATRCLFCERASDQELYPARLYEDSFSGYTFSARRLRRREHYRLVRCAGCGLVRSDPVAPPSRLQGLYQESEFLYEDEAPHAAATYDQLLAGLLARHPLPRPPASLLEVGCGSGHFLALAQERGLTVTGFEPSQECWAQSPEKVRPRIIPEIFSPERLAGRRFDLAASFHVFDHLFDPRQVLAQMAQHLNPGGRVLLVCHDVEAWSAKLLGDRSPIFDVEHIYLFSRATLAHLVEAEGFRVLELDSLRNRYPLGYWLRMAPGGATLSKGLPRACLRIPLSIKAGNLYVWAQLTRGGAC